MIRLNSRDKRIFWSCAVSQVLTTSQVQRWHCAGASANTVQKRIRKLVEGGYLSTVETRVCKENLVILGKEGAKHLKQAGWKEELKNEIPKDLEHHLGVVDIRIAVDQGLTNLAGMKIRYFYAYWELGRFQWSYALIPDAIFSLRNDFTMQVAVEFDRNTETTDLFAKKLLLYRPLILNHPISTVMVVAEKESDMERLVLGLDRIRDRIPVIIVGLAELNKMGLGAVAEPQARLYGSRTIAEQLEIDAAKKTNDSR